MRSGRSWSVVILFGFRVELSLVLLFFEFHVRSSNRLRWESHLITTGRLVDACCWWEGVLRTPSLRDFSRQRLPLGWHRATCTAVGGWWDEGMLCCWAFLLSTCGSILSFLSLSTHTDRTHVSLPSAEANAAGPENRKKRERRETRRSS